MKNIVINEVEYEIIEDYRNALEKEILINKITDYFDDYDYILGDISYGKLRLKGFCDKNNKKCNPINNIENKEQYLKNECAYNCRYFLIKKTK